MNKINFKDIDFSKLEMLSSQGSKSIIYKSENTCYKILTDLFNHEKKDLYKKFLEMDGLKIDNVLMPIELIIHEDQLEGYTMKYINNSKNLYDIYSTKELVDANELIESFKTASKILKDVHNNGIIFQDISFSNIIKDENNNIYLCDIDGCKHKEYKGPFVPELLRNFIEDYKRLELNPSKNTDRLSLYLSLLYLIYNKKIQYVSKEEYDYLANNVISLQILKEYLSDILEQDSNMKELLYLDDIYLPKETFIIDRTKQTEFIKSLHK